MRGWRNRQTRWIQVPVPERAWGFNSPSRTERNRRNGFSPETKVLVRARFALVKIMAARVRYVPGGFYVNEPTP